jgi:hypothetical protein
MRASLLLLAALSAACLRPRDAVVRPPTAGDDGPRISSVSPAHPQAGAVVTIRGRGFGAERHNGWVTLASSPAVDFPTVLSWSDERIDVRLAHFLTEGGQLQVRAHGRSSPLWNLSLGGPCGTTEFTREYDLGDSSEGHALVALDNCRVLVAGRCRTGGQWDGFLLLLDGQGDIVGDDLGLRRWPRKFGGEGDDGAFDLLAHDDGSLWLVGYRTDEGSGLERAYLWVVEGDGDLRLERPLDEGDGPSRANALVRAHDGTILVTGHVEGGVTAERRAQVWSLDARGNPTGSSVSFGSKGSDFEGHSICLGQHGWVVAGLERRLEQGQMTVYPWIQPYLPYLPTAETEALSYAPGRISEVRQVGKGLLVCGERDRGAGFWPIAAGLNQWPLSVPVGQLGSDVLMSQGSGIVPDPDGQPDLAEAVAAQFDPYPLESCLRTTHCGDRHSWRSFVIAGDAFRGPSCLVHLDCNGHPLETRSVASREDPSRWVHLRDLDQVPSASPVPPCVLVAGFSDVDEESSRLLVAKRQGFADPRPTIARFDIGGAVSLDLPWQDPDPILEFSWDVTDADQVVLRLIQAPQGFTFDDVVLNAPGTGHAVPLVGFSGWSCWGSSTGPTSSSAPCGPLIFELVARSESTLRCPGGESRRQVTVFPDLDGSSPALIQRLTSMVTVLARFGRFDQFALTDPLLPAHPVFLAGGGLIVNRCFTGLGLPYARTHAGEELLANWASATAPTGPGVIDDREPGLLLYRAAANGSPTTLAAWGYGAQFDGLRPQIEGENWGSGELWFGHFGGYHTGDGTMSILTPAFEDECHAVPDWTRPPLQPPACDSLDPASWGLPPHLAHPALWDLRLFLDPTSGLPRSGIFAGEVPIQSIPDPCAGLDPSIALPALTDAALNLPDISTFFLVGDGGQVEPIAIPHPDPLLPP